MNTSVRLNLAKSVAAVSNRRQPPFLPLLPLLILTSNSFAQNSPAPPPPDDDIRAPKPQIEIPVPADSHWLPWTITAAVILALAIGLFLWWRNRSPRRIEIAAGDRALKALHEIDRERNSLLPGPFADRAAGVVRQFIADKFRIAAPQRTTEEFLRSLETAPPLVQHRDLLRTFLQSCDTAKFAGAEFDTAERLALLQNALHFIRAAASWQPVPPSPLPAPA